MTDEIRKNIRPDTVNASTARLRVLHDLESGLLIDEKYHNGLIHYITETMCFEIPVKKVHGKWLVDGNIAEVPLQQPPTFTGCRVIAKF